MNTSTQSATRMSLAFQWILKTKDGCVNGSSDETDFGISKRQYPHLDIASLTVEERMGIYRIDYYEAYRCNELPEALGLFLLDPKNVDFYKKRTFVR